MRREADDLLRDFFGDGKAKERQTRRSHLDEMKRLDASLDFDAVERRIERDMESFAIQKNQASAQIPPIQTDKESQAEAFRSLYIALCGEILGQEPFLQSFCTALRRPFVTGDKGGSILIWGDKCSGRHSAVKLAAKFLREKRLLSSGDVAVLDLALYPEQGQEKLFIHDMYRALSQDACFVVFDNYEKCHPAFLSRLSELAVSGKMNLASRYVLQKGRLADVGNTLTSDGIAALERKNKYLIFISQKDQNTMASLMGAQTVNALSDICRTQPFDKDSIQAIARRLLAELQKKCLAQLGLKLADNPSAAAEYLASGFDAQKKLQGVLSRADMLYRGLAEYKLKNDTVSSIALVFKDGRAFVCADEKETDIFSLLPGEYTGEKEKAKAELNEIVGLESVKEYILSLEKHYEVLSRRKAMGLNAGGVNMHMIFTGNPGTGKTTVARITAKYLKAIGVLSGGQLVEVSRADLVGKYVGHTAPLTQQVLKSAKGGVLFIDEAYSLYRGENDSFGLEAIDTLVKGMEDNRDDLVVILAGYTREMEEFLESNSGLSSRFPNKIEFPDYSAEEMLKIACSIAKGKGYFIAAEAEKDLLCYFEKVQSAKNARSGNGRLARNVVEKAILKQSARVLADMSASLSELRARDFELGE